MTEAFDLLDYQPQNWPRWHQGVLTNNTVTADRHLFLFLRITDGTAQIGRVRPACHFVDGAEPVIYQASLRSQDSPYLNHCRDCQEVDLQYGLRVTTT